MRGGVWGACWLLCVVAGVCARVFVFSLDGVPEALSQRPELSSPTSSFDALLEGLYRQLTHHDPYAGDDALRQPPLLLLPLLAIAHHDHDHDHDDHGSQSPLALARRVGEMHGLLCVRAAFVVLDVAIACLLSSLVCHLATHTRAHHGLRSPHPTASTLALVVTAVYMCNPVGVCLCCALCPSLFHSFFVLLSVWLSVKGRGVGSGSALGIACVLSPHSLLLLPLLIAQCSQHSNLSTLRAGTLMVLGVVLSAACALYACALVAGSTRFVSAVYGFALAVSDHVPGLGLYWYPNLLMFDEFDGCFTFLFEYQLLVLPIAMLVTSFRKHASLCVVAMLGALSLFKPYPTAADNVYLLLLLPFHHLIVHTKFVVFEFSTLLFTALLCPLLWDLWVASCTGNANFFFGAVLWYVGAHAGVICDAMHSCSRMDYEAEQAKAAKEA